MRTLSLQRKLSFFFLIFLSASAWAHQDVEIAAAVDLHHLVSDQKSDGDQLSPRGVELSLSGPLDPRFEGKLNIAGHEEAGLFRYELHEAYVQSSQLIPASSLKLGRFFLGVGRLNQIHRHDWPFPSAPQVQERFFAAEGASDDGFEFQRHWGEEQFYSLSFGVTDSYTYGHAHEAGKRPPHPLLYSRGTTFFETESGGSLWGLNLLYRTSAEKEKTLLAGLDFVHKRRNGKTLEFLLQSELWFRDRQYPTVDRVRETGAYVYSQWALNESWLAGLRLDGFVNHSLRFVTTQELRRDFDYALVPVLQFQSSEFAQFRMSAGRYVNTTQGDADQVENKLEFQAVFILGAHPPHDF